MEDHTADFLVEERDELMVPASGGNPVLRKAHFLKPMLSEDDPVQLPPPPNSLLSPKPTFRNHKNLFFGYSKTYASEKWKLWVEKMKPNYQETWKKSGIYHAILASTYNFKRDKMLVLGLAEYWCCDTNTFIFPWGEVTITLEDIMHLGCFSVLGASILTPLNDEFNDVFNCLRSAAKKIRVAAGHVTPCSWMEHFMSSGMDIEHEAFLVCWLSRFVFPRSRLVIQDFRVAVHLSRGNRIALAPVVLACIYRDMSVLSSSMVKSVESESRIGVKFTTWHYDIVQMWVWERFAGFGLYANVIEREEPRSARWNGVANLYLSIVRMASFDSAKSSFLWRPYAMISSSSMLSNIYNDNEQWVVVESDAAESFARCLRASKLVGFGHIEQYFPHRVAMQFGFDQDIPPLVMNLVLDSYDRPIRGVKLYIPPRRFESDVSSRYEAWWRGHVAGNVKMGTNSNHSKELLPLVSCGHKRNAETLATPGSRSGCVEETPQNDLTTAEYMIRSGGSDSFGRIIDLDDDDPVIDGNDDVEGDSLTIAQLLNRSRKTNNFENERAVGDELVLETVTSKLIASAICPEATKKLTCMSEPVEPSVPILPTSNLCEESKSSAKKHSGLKEDAVVARGFKFNNKPLEMSAHSVPCSDNSKKRKSFTERQLEVENNAVVSSEDNIVKRSTPSDDNGKKRKSSTERQTQLEENAVKVSRGNKDEDKKPGKEPIQIDATEEVAKGCTSSLEVNVVSSSSDSHSNVSFCKNHSDRCCLSKLNSYSSRGRSSEIVGTSISSNHRDDTQYKFPSDSQLIVITSDDEDSIELNSVPKKICHYVDDEALSAERVQVHGFDGVESDRVIKFLPVNIFIGYEIFWNARLTLTRNHVKLEAEGSVHGRGPITCEWTTSDIVGIKSVWSKNISHVGLHLHLKSKDGESVINVEDSGIIKLDWEVSYADWQELRNRIWALDSRYKDAWLSDSPVDAVNIEGVLMDKFSSHHFRDAGDLIATFPKGDPDAVSICWSDVQLLQPKTFINDTIIDFYMKYLKDKVKHKEVPRFHFFNCFFFRKLVDLDGDLSIESEGREAFLRVHKWTRKLDLFEKDYILIPVNFSFHWSLIVICHPAEVANLKDEELKKLANPEEKEMEELCKMPCILHMDSLKGSHRGLRKLFQGYLSEEWKERRNDLGVDISSRFWDVPFFSLEVPQQQNLFDCGLFLLHYAELFMEEAPENFNYSRILKSSSNFLKEHWFIPAEASSKHAHIKGLIHRISVDHSCDVGAFDIRSPSESTEVNECNNSGQFLNEVHTSTDTCLVNSSNCTSHQKFGAKEAPFILQCDGEHKLNNDEISDSRYNARSPPSDRYCHLE